MPPRVAIAFERLPAWPASMSLMPLCAPWHTAGADGWETAKWTSYGANIASTRKAQGEGFDDALLLAVMDRSKLKKLTAKIVSSRRLTYESEAARKTRESIEHIRKRAIDFQEADANSDNEVRI